MLKHKKWIAIIALVPIVLLFFTLGKAQIQSLANYLKVKDVIDSGGGTSQSTNYSLTDAIGQPASIGESASTNYAAHAGFLYGESAPATEPVLVVSPTTLNFGTTQTTMTFSISNAGTGTLTWSATENPDKPWITSISPTSGTGNATVAVTVDRSQLTENSDTGTIAVTSNGGDVNVTVMISQTPSGGIVFTAPNVTGGAGSAVDVPISVTDLTGAEVYAFTMIINTDASVLVPTGVSTEGTVLGSWGDVVTSISGGQISMTGAEISPMSGSGTFVIIHYQINAAAAEGATSTIEFTNVLLNEGDPAATTVNGLFTVSSGYNISGTIRYHQNNNPVENATVTIDGHTTTTANDGTFSFSAIPGGTVTLKPSKSGDVRSAISAFDASMLLRYNVGLISLDPYQLLAGDVSGNGSVSPFDASYILQYNVGLISQFPIGADWRFVHASFSINESNWPNAPDSILYSPLNANMIDQDFIGLVYGDVTGNWSAAGLAKNLTGSAIVELGQTNRESQREFVLPVTATVTGAAYSATVKIFYDKNALDLKEVRLGEKLSSFIEAHNARDGRLTIALAGADPLTDFQANLLYLKFEAKNPDPARETSLKLEESIMNDGQISVTINNGLISLNPALPTKHELEQNFPNPFNPKTSIGYKLAKPGMVKITIFDVNGKEVRRLVHETKEAGSYSVEWNGKDRFGSMVASGVYFYRLEIIELGKTGQVFTDLKKMVFMK